MKISELMQRDVVTITPDASLKEAAALLVEHGISGLPVCLPDGRLAGVISEADILVKEQGFAVDESPGLVGRILEQAYGDGARLVAVTVGEAMSTPAVTIEPTEPVSAAAALMTRRRVNRLPVVEGGRLVGIVTRADLVRAFVRTDGQIESEICEDVLRDVLWISPDTLEIDVDSGVVTLRGRIQTNTTAEILTALIRRVPGVVAVHAELESASNDLARRRTFPGRLAPRP